MSATILHGDCIEQLRTMDAGSVQCCVTSPPYFGLRSYLPNDHQDKALEIGLEETPAAYVERIVGVFREVRRVLADDGTLWLNLGDSYASKPNGPAGTPKPDSIAPHVAARTAHARRSSQIPEGLKHKDLIGIPWRVAFALQDDGWYLRQDIVWSKPNPMPESVRDRCTKAHEYLFLLSKSPRYYYDAEAIKEPAAPASLARWAQNVDGQRGSDRVPGKTNGTMKAVGGPRSRRDGFVRDSGKAQRLVPGQAAAVHRSDRRPSEYDTAVRNRRSVWTVATKPYKGAHFATFPPALVEPCILAGSRPGDLVLDPFGGSGTTAAVALKHGRRAVLCELNAEYLPLIEKRISEVAVLLSRSERKRRAESAAAALVERCGRTLDMFAEAVHAE